MIEIAISLAVIGFALLAIVGILPTAMNVQQNNRQETIINQDASIFMNAIRNGEQGLDYLTNYVIAITNYQTAFKPGGIPIQPIPTYTYGYTYTNSSLNGSPAHWPITNGFNIIGLLSTPEIIPLPNGGFYSNHVVALVRSISGSADQNPPQTNSTVQDFALHYRLFSTVVPYGTNSYYPGWLSTNGVSPTVYTQRWDYAILVQYYQANMHELRLTFRWPVLPNGGSGLQRQVFRTIIDGPIFNYSPLPPHATYPPATDSGLNQFFFVQPNVFYRGSTATFYGASTPPNL